MGWFPFRSFVETHLDPRPPPPELPKFDPNDEPSKWSWTRMKWNMPVDKGPIEWTPIGTQPKSPDEPDWRGVIRNKVIEYPMPEEYKYNAFTPSKYFWFDTPDYADPFKKMWFSFKAFLWSGLVVSSFRWSYEGNGKHLAAVLEMTRKYLPPWLMAGLAGSATVLTVANLRGKKDDYYNYALGGSVFATIIGRRDYRYMVRYNVICIPLAIYLKHNAETNGQLVKRGVKSRQYFSITGSDAERGLVSGDWRLGVRSSWGDPGRDIRKPY